MKTIREMHIEEKARKYALAKATATQLGKALSEKLSPISYPRDYIVTELINEGKATWKEVIVNTSGLPNGLEEIIEDSNLKTFAEFEIRETLEKKLNSLLGNSIYNEGLELSVKLSLCSYGEISIGWDLFVRPAPSYIPPSIESIRQRLEGGFKFYMQGNDHEK